VKVPTASTPKTDPASANAGRFSVSLKGMRRDLRRAGGKAEALVRDVETVIVEWLTEGGTVLRPDHVDSGLQSVGKPVGLTGAIVEVSRTPLQLIWRIVDDAFARYVVHCCARYHEVVSFSKFPYFPPDKRLLPSFKVKGQTRTVLPTFSVQTSHALIDAPALRWRRRQ